jgi:hypothetical protein
VEVEVGTLTVVLGKVEKATEKPELSSASLNTGSALLSVTTGSLTVSSLALVHGPASGNETSFSLMHLNDAGELSLTDCTVAAASSPLVFRSSLFLLLGGSFSLTNCACASLTLADVAVVECPSAVLVALTGNNITQIQRTTGSGSIVSGTVSTPGQLVIVGGQLEGECVNGMGGALSVALAEGRTGPTGGTLTMSLSETTISNCLSELPVAQGPAEGYGGGLLLDLRRSVSFAYHLRDLIFDENQARWGRNVFVLANDLSVAAPLAKFDLTFEPPLTRAGTFMGARSVLEGIPPVDLTPVARPHRWRRERPVEVRNVRPAMRVLRPWSWAV